MLNTDRQQAVGIEFLQLAARIMRLDPNTQRALNAIKNTRHGETTLVIYLALIAGPDNFRIHQHQQLIACVGDIDHDDLLMHIDLRCCQPDTGRGVHSVCHIGDKFRQSLVDRGFFRPSYAHVAYRLVELCGLFALAACTIPFSPLAATLLFGLFGGRCGWVQHEGGHNSLTGHMRCDKWLQAFFIGFGLHSSGGMWNQMHNKHHATPQKVNHDIDLDTTPLVAFFDTAVEKNRRKAYSKWWLRWQAYTFLPITSGVLVPLFWVLYLHPRQVIRERNVAQAVWMALGHLVRPYLFVALGGVAWYQAVLYHMLSTWWGDMYLFGHFALSHTTTPIVESDQDPSWVRYAIEHSVDITPQNPLVCWTMGYLNCQVIHHLFPSMPQFRGPAVSLELIQWCEKWRLSYQIVGYWEAWSAMFANLSHVGRVYSGDRPRTALVASKEE